MIVALLLAAAAPAEASSIDADARCFAVMSTIAGDGKTAELKQAGTFGTLIWYGRLSARLSIAEIEAVARKAAPKIAGEAFQIEAARCGAEMKAHGDALKAMGARLGANPPSK